MKKISQIVAYSILGIIVVGLVLTAVLKKDFSPNIAIPAYNQGIGDIYLDDSTGTKHDGFSSKDKSEYDKFVGLYKDSFKLTILYSIFSGEISRTQEITNLGKSKPSYPTGIIVTFQYAQSQVLKSNGKVYHESTNSTSETLYKKLFFTVEQEKGLTTQKIYFYCDENSCYYQLTTLANFDELYDYLSSLPAFAEQE